MPWIVVRIKWNKSHSAASGKHSILVASTWSQVCMGHAAPGERLPAKSTHLDGKEDAHMWWAFSSHLCMWSWVLVVKWGCLEALCYTNYDDWEVVSSSLTHRKNDLKYGKSEGDLNSYAGWKPNVVENIHSVRHMFNKLHVLVSL